MQINAGDTCFMLIASALVLLMTPGLALFYCGMVKKKNVLNTIMMSFIVLGVLTIQWVMFGYSLAFGKDIHGFIGSLNWFGLNGVGLEPNEDYAATIPHLVFMVFQMMFALITAALISGAVVERMRFSAYIVIIVAWSTFVYDPLVHWVWGAGGWLKEMGVLDFAGGTVVEMASGVSALVLAMLLGKRKTAGGQLIVPHNLPLTVLGAALLWFGWFGFNAGSALAANEVAASAFVATQIAGGAATVSWALVEFIHHGKPTMLGVVSGCIAGLVAITPACGFVTPIAALIIGLLVSPIAYYAVSELKTRLGYDDTLDVFGLHGISGTFGTIATGVFATKAVNPAGANGLLYGNAHQLLIQLISVGATWALSIIATVVIFKVVSSFMEVRVTEDEEVTGLDLIEHGENAYNTDDVLGIPVGIPLRPVVGTNIATNPVAESV